MFKLIDCNFHAKVTKTMWTTKFIRHFFLFSCDFFQFLVVYTK